VPDVFGLVPEDEVTIREAVGRFGCSFTMDDWGGVCVPHYSQWYVDWSCCYRAILEAILVASADADRLAAALRGLSRGFGEMPPNWEQQHVARIALAAHVKGLIGA
jgi:hypothetical protein